VHTLPLPEMTKCNLNPPVTTKTRKSLVPAKTPSHRERRTPSDLLVARCPSGATGLQLSALSFNRPPSGLWPPSPLRGGLGFTPFMSSDPRDTLSQGKGLALTTILDMNSRGTFSHGSSIRSTPFIPIGTRDALTSKKRVGISAVRRHEFRGTFFPTGSGGD